ncbi:MAG: hypothetical protein RIE77_08550 [Phycisphaerales bacterium]|jgi:hypothetical protein
MARVPDTDAAFLDFAREHIDVWSGGEEPPPVIGLSSQQLLDTESATAAAEAADQAAREARNASKAATVAKRNAFAALEAIIGADIDTIDAFAKATQDPDVYALAQIDPPKEPSERPAPPKPTDLALTSFPDGSLRLSFKVSAAGAVFEVQRSTTDLVGQDSPWTTIAVTGEKMYTDPAVPGGLRSIQYRVRGILGNNNAGEWSTPEPLSFGSQGSQSGPASAASEDAA